MKAKLWFATLPLAGLLLGLIAAPTAGAAQATQPSRQLGTGVVVRLAPGLLPALLNALLHTTSQTLSATNNVYLLQSTVGTSTNDLLALIGRLLPGLVLSAEPNYAVTFNDANLNQSGMSVLDQSGMSVLDQSGMSVLDGEGAGSLAGASVNSAYTGQPAVAQIAASSQPSLALTGAGVLVADIDNGSDPTNLVLAPWYAPGWNFLDNSPDWSCWSDQSLVPLQLLNGLSVVNNQNGSGSSSVNQSGMSVLDQSGMSVLDQSGMSVLDQSGMSVLNGSNVVFAPGAFSILNGNLIAAPGYDAFFQMYTQHPEFGHGTAVLGMVHLIAPNARLMPLKAFTPDGNGDLASILNSLYFAVQSGARVINMSFSSPTNSPSLAAAIQYAWQHGAVLTASAGNNSANETLYPGAYPNVLNTAAVDGNNQLASFSDFGPSIVLAAPGVALVTTYPDNLWALASGTSFSAPLVAGEAALLRGTGASNSAVVAAIDNSANGGIPANTGNDVGHGLIQVQPAQSALGATNHP